MADTTLERPTDRAKLTEAEQLRAYAQVAEIYDTLLDDIGATLHAICEGGLFDAGPADKTERANHNAGHILLSKLRHRVEAAQKTIAASPGTDLFIYLEVAARDLDRKAANAD